MEISDVIHSVEQIWSQYNKQYGHSGFYCRYEIKIKKIKSPFVHILDPDPSPRYSWTVTITSTFGGIPFWQVNRRGKLLRSFEKIKEGIVRYGTRSRLSINETYGLMHCHKILSNGLKTTEVILSIDSGRKPVLPPLNNAAGVPESIIEYDRYNFFFA